jgi:hypothetical protein
MVKKKHPRYLPKELKVKEVSYKIQPRSMSWSNKNKALGQCDYINRSLEVAITPDEEENLSTLAHEYAHAYIYRYRIKAKKKWTEEQLVRWFEKVFTKLHKQLLTTK